MARSVLESKTDNVLQEMLQTDNNEHNLLIYPDLKALKQLYSLYIKNRLENNEIIVFLSAYQTVDSVRQTLRGPGLDVTRFEQDGSLLILDSVRTYFGPDSDILSMIKLISKRTENQRKDGCSIIADMGSFNLVGKENEMVKLETSVPLKFQSIRCRASCCYHQANFDRLSESDKQMIFQHHYKILIIADEKQIAN